MRRLAVSKPGGQDFLMFQEMKGGDKEHTEWLVDEASNWGYYAISSFLPRGTPAPGQEYGKCRGGVTICVHRKHIDGSEAPDSEVERHEIVQGYIFGGTDSQPGDYVD